ncbi:MAG TPA: acyltransferase [Bryobacteraceae bacterium]|nr:acyltransferase [Bryobacteraceae bacterium]
MKTLARWFEISGGKSDRFASMEGLRGIAILLVFLDHYYDIIWRDLPLHSPALSALGKAMLGAGGTGVALFFVLSGFLIYGAVRKPALDLRKFLVRRTQRIYPAFLAVLLIYLAMSPFLHLMHSNSDRYTSRLPDTPAGTALYVLANIAFIPGIFPVKPIMNVAWSLSYEWFFYLILPIVIMGLGLCRWQRKTRCAFFLSGALLFLIANIAFPAVFYFPGNPGRETHVEAIMFAAGILLYELVETQRMAKWNPAVVDAAAWIFGAAAIAVGAASGIAKNALTAPDARFAEIEAVLTASLFVGYFALVLAALVPGTRTARVLSARPIRWLGNMSFSFYLIHGLPLHIFGILAGRLHAGSLSGMSLWIAFAAALPFVFAGTAATSAVLFLAVEKRLSLAPHKPSVKSDRSAPSKGLTAVA